MWNKNHPSSIMAIFNINPITKRGKWKVKNDKKTIDKKTTQITNFPSCCSSAIYQPLLNCLWLSSIVSYQFTKLRSIREWHRGKTTRTRKTTCKTRALGAYWKMRQCDSASSVIGVDRKAMRKSTKDKIYKDKWQRNNWQKDKMTNLQN